MEEKVVDFDEKKQKLRAKTKKFGAFLIDNAFEIGVGVVLINMTMRSAGYLIRAIKLH